MGIESGYYTDSVYLDRRLKEKDAICNSVLILVKAGYSILNIAGGFRGL